MSEYNIDYFLSDFANRTIKNLEFIEMKYHQEELYEVTQLINSLLGLIIIPVEAYKKQKLNNDDKLKETSEKDYEAIEELLMRCKSEKRLHCDYPDEYYEVGEEKRLYICKFISHLRNSIAHSGNRGIHFYPISENKKISEIIFYDQCVQKKFCIEIKLHELRTLIQCISNLYCTLDENNSCYRGKKREYEEEIRDLRKLMETSGMDKQSSE